MSILGSIGGYLSGNDRVKGAKNAGNAASAVLDNSQAAKTYSPLGADAFRTQAGLLGVGGDPAASQRAFENYLGSTGYRSALQGGNDAITSSMAAGLGNKSGAADKARLRFGTGLANQYFNNYFNQTGQLAGAGQRADEFVSGGKADVKYRQYSDMGEARGARTDAIFSGIGDAVGAMSGGAGGFPGASAASGASRFMNVWG